MENKLLTPKRNSGFELGHMVIQKMENFANVENVRLF